MARMLIADDAAPMRMRCSKLLVENGHEVIQATNGVEVVEKFKETKPDGVLLDITMPKMDGIMALREILKFDSTAQVVMITVMGQPIYVMNALKAGARDFITKPFDEARVMDAVSKLLN